MVISFSTLCLFHISSRINNRTNWFHICFVFFFIPLCNIRYPQLDPVCRCGTRTDWWQFRTPEWPRKILFRTPCPRCFFVVWRCFGCRSRPPEWEDRSGSPESKLSQRRVFVALKKKDQTKMTRNII